MKTSVQVITQKKKFLLGFQGKSVLVDEFLKAFPSGVVELKIEAVQFTDCTKDLRGDAILIFRRRHILGYVKPPFPTIKMLEDQMAEIKLLLNAHKAEMGLDVLLGLAQMLLGAGAQGEIGIRAR